MVLRDASTLVRPRLGSRVALRLSYSPALDGDGRALGVLSDAKIVAQILANLGINAAKATQTGFIELAIHAIRVIEAGSAGVFSAAVHDASSSTAHQSAPRLLVSFAVRDSGVGIAAETLPTVFGRYTTNGGLGLGLYLARMQVETLSPTQPLSVRSPWTAQHAGAEFSFEAMITASGVTHDVPDLRTISADRSPTDGAPAVSAPAALTPLPSTLRVLIADDQKINRMLLQTALRKGCGGGAWEIVQVESANAAVQAVLSATHPFDLVFVDEIFGEDPSAMRGSTAIDRIRKHEAQMRDAQRDATPSGAASTAETGQPPRVIVVSCTGNAAYEAPMLKELGADDVWGKPYPSFLDGVMQRRLAMLFERAEQQPAALAVQSSPLVLRRGEGRA